MDYPWCGGNRINSEGVVVDGCLGLYQRGCRCQDCRDTVSAAARALRRRKLYGVETGTDRVDIGPSRDALLRMRATGASWVLIAELVASDKRSVQRTATGNRLFITRSLADRIAHVDRWFADHRAAAAEIAGSPFVDATVPQWMIGALLARGWSAVWIGEQLGSNKMIASDMRRPTVRRETAAKLEAVFLAYHDVWGPSRVGARRMWRKGTLPSECYDWEQSIPDLRVIPGSFDPALVREAATFAIPNRQKTTGALAAMAVLGQWPDERCARTAMRFWGETTGRSTPQEHLRKRDGVWCWNKKHHHGSLPMEWREHQSEAS